MQNEAAEPFAHFIEHLKGIGHKEARKAADGGVTVIKDEGNRRALKT
jgi:hypothetical protein